MCCVDAIDLLLPFGPGPTLIHHLQHNSFQSREIHHTNAVMRSHPLHPPRRTPKGHRPAVAPGAGVGEGDGGEGAAQDAHGGGARRELVDGGGGGA